MTEEMKTSKILILIMLLLVIGMAGCAEDTDDTQAAKQGDGIVITNIRTDFRTIEAEEDMTLAVNFENRGDRTATGIEGEVIRKGSFMVDPIYVEASSSLEPPIEGTYSSDEFTWRIIAPPVTERRIEQLQTRLHYNYVTEAYATVHFVPRDILRDKGDESFMMSATSTTAPLSIEIVSNQPAVIREDDMTELGCYGYEFNCADVTDQTACEELSNCNWAGDQCTGIPPVPFECRNMDNQIACRAVTGGPDEYNVCEWGIVKDIRMTIIVKNIGNGRIEKRTESGVVEEDVIEKLIVEAIGGPSCVIREEIENEGVSPVPLRRIDFIDFGGTKLVGAEKAQTTLTSRFVIHDTDAATSCQIKVTAEYGYRTDSDILSISIEPKL